VVGHLSANELLAQNANTGITDLLFLNAHGSLIGSAQGGASLPQIAGVGDFAGSLSNHQAPFMDQPTFVSQLPDGELDLLRFDAGTGAITKSDLVANTAGFAPVVGVGGAFDRVDVGGNFHLPALAGVGLAENVFLQLPNGQVDAIGFNGSFEDQSLSVASSSLLSGALPKVEAVNQLPDFSGGPSNLDVEQLAQVIEQIGPQPVVSTLIQSAATQMISQLPDGSFDLLYHNSGYDELHLGGGNEGAFYASQQLNLSMPGWHAIDADAVTAQVFG
jgi:hypothetical protein